MKLNKWLLESAKQLESAGIGTARLDALVLLEDILCKNRAYILAHDDTELTASQELSLSKMLAKRIRHVPLAYIRGKTEFYGREFIINEQVLEPRPESETMIGLLLGLSKRKSLEDRNLALADIGTGSGALAITAKCELPSLRVLATDIDNSCLAIAKKNAKKHHADIKCLQGDLLTPLLNLNEHLWAVLANLPYVPLSHTINEAAMNEPHVAIFGGEDGLEVYRKFFSQLSPMPQKPENLFTESLPFQHALLATIAGTSGYRLIRTDDFIQQFKLR